MNAVFRLVATLAAGAAAMYYLDPVAGRRRRALVRDKAAAACHDAEDFTRAKCRRAADRLQGIVAETRSRIAPQAVGDQQLHDRIRARLGHVVERPSAVEVEVHDGHVVLHGSVLASEMDEAVEAVSTIQGVEELDSRLTVRDMPGTEASAGSASTLQH